MNKIVKITIVIVVISLITVGFGFLLKRILFKPECPSGQQYKMCDGVKTCKTVPCSNATLPPNAKGYQLSADCKKCLLKCDSNSTLDITGRKCIKNKGPCKEKTPCKLITDCCNGKKCIIPSGKTIGTCKLPCLGRTCSKNPDCCQDSKSYNTCNFTSGSGVCGKRPDNCSHSGDPCGAAPLFPCCDKTDVCISGTCKPKATCVGIGDTCTTPSDCCLPKKTGIPAYGCRDKKCCVKSGNACKQTSGSSDCCGTLNCISGTCQTPTPPPVTSTQCCTKPGGKIETWPKSQYNTPKSALN